VLSVIPADKKERLGGKEGQLNWGCSNRGGGLGGEKRGLLRARQLEDRGEKGMGKLQKKGKLKQLKTIGRKKKSLRGQRGGTFPKEKGGGIKFRIGNWGKKSKSEKREGVGFLGVDN